LEKTFVRFEGALMGRAASFKVDLATQEESGDVIVAKSTGTHHGIVIIDSDGSGFDGLEEAVDSISIFRALRIG